MSNTLATVTSQHDRLPARDPRIVATELKARIQTIQHVMRDVMIRDVHYGKIPGTDKLTLLKPGSEVLLATFQIATTIVVEDLSTPDCVRYRVRVIGVHSLTGMVVGEGIGECSSNESKYRWKKAGSDTEFELTPETHRRIEHKSGKNGRYTVKQVRTEPADQANTILKMAKKRAQVDMTLTATGASDCFEQDLEEFQDEDAPAPPPAPQRPERALYPADAFAKNFATWQELVGSGKKTSAQIIAMLESKAILSDEQRAELIALRVLPQDEPTQNEGTDNAGDAE